MNQSYFKIETDGLTYQRYDYRYGDKDSQMATDNIAWDTALLIKKNNPEKVVTVRHCVDVVTEVKSESP